MRSAVLKALARARTIALEAGTDEAHRKERLKKIAKR